MKTMTQAFTLIELLVVVAIIGILTSIAMPNFQHAQIKAKTTRALADMRTLVTALEAYSTDNNSYPLDGNDYFERDESLYDQIRIQSVLTTPVPYISEIFSDIFHTRETQINDPLVKRLFQDRPPFPYVYTTKDNIVLHRGNPHAYFIFSFGPDQDFDNASSKPEDILVYDATNGIISDGDILRKGP
ncbi:MAG: prepilin-type N-terminal cleavage/methylation domain-containing protein [Candidatus Hinthialibacter antarcticus]|nr:prepilin-type N-terminal cleavage/methylation domain-containing protein [Candidatus Hinthialibacter antarcticus]